MSEKSSSVVSDVGFPGGGVEAVSAGRVGVDDCARLVACLLCGCIGMTALLYTRTIFLGALLAAITEYALQYRHTLRRIILPSLSSQLTVLNQL